MKYQIWIKEMKKMAFIFAGLMLVLTGCVSGSLRKKAKEDSWEAYSAENWKYTDNGYFFFEQKNPVKSLFGYTAVRVKSLDDHTYSKCCLAEKESPSDDIVEPTWYMKRLTEEEWKEYYNRSS